jgi:hypothetical protein
VGILGLSLTSHPLHSTMAHMQYIVDRYHSSSVSFPTRWQAFEFAMECGDFAGIRVEKAILDRSHFTQD